MSQSLYTLCAEVLSLAQSRNDDLASLLDPETGFAPKLRYICQQTLSEAAAQGSSISNEELEALRMLGMDREVGRLEDGVRNGWMLDLGGRLERIYVFWRVC